MRNSLPADVMPSLVYTDFQGFTAALSYGINRFLLGFFEKNSVLFGRHIIFGMFTVPFVNLFLWERCSFVAVVCCFEGV